MKSLKHLPKKNKDKYPKLQGLIETDQVLFEEVQQLVSDRQRDVSLFYRGLENNTNNESNVSVEKDSHYQLYENLRRTPVSIDYKNNPQIKENNEDTSKSVIEAYTGFEFGSSNVNGSAGSLVLGKRQTLGELRVVQLLANSRFRSDPHMIAIVGSIKRYLFGNGIKVTISDSNIQESIRDKLDQVKFNELMANSCISSILDGESGLKINDAVRLVNKKKTVEFAIQQIFSEEVDAIETSNKNTAVKLAYKVGHNAVDGGSFGKSKDKDFWIADIDYYSGLNSRNTPVKIDWAKSKYHSSLSSNETMVFMKFSNLREIRGISQVESILRSLRLHEDFVTNRAILNYERSKVLYLHKIKGGGSPKLNQYNLNKSPSPRGGTQLNINQHEDYEIVTPALHAADAEKDGLLFLYEASSGTNTPLSIVAQRLNEANYSAIKNADSPFNQMILDYAVIYIEYMTTIIRYMIKKMVKAKELPNTVKVKRFIKEVDETEFIQNIFTKLKEGKDSKDIITDLSDYSDNTEEVTIPTENLPIDIIIADAVRPNPLEMAKVWFIYRKLGIVSRQTLSGKAGFVWEQEIFRQLQEKSFFEDLSDEDSSAAGLDDKTDQGEVTDKGSSANTSSNVDDGSKTENN